MKQIAILDTNNVVINTRIVADDAPLEADQVLMEIGVEIGMLYDRNNETFPDARTDLALPPENAPPEDQSEPEARPPAPLSPVDFKFLFTSDERIACRKSTDEKVMDYFALLDDPRLDSVDLNHPSIIEGVNHLESLKILKPDRAAQILQGTPPNMPTEEPEEDGETKL